MYTSAHRHTSTTTNPSNMYKRNETDLLSEYCVYFSLCGDFATVTTTQASKLNIHIETHFNAVYFHKAKQKMGISTTYIQTAIHIRKVANILFLFIRSHIVCRQPLHFFSFFCSLVFIFSHVFIKQSRV